MDDDLHIQLRRPRWWTRLLDRIDERVSGPIDDDARGRGWTVMVLPGTRTHVYRVARHADLVVRCGPRRGSP